MVGNFRHKLSRCTSDGNLRRLDLDLDLDLDVDLGLNLDLDLRLKLSEHEPIRAPCLQEM